MDMNLERNEDFLPEDFAEDLRWLDRHRLVWSADERDLPPPSRRWMDRNRVEWSADELHCDMEIVLRHCICRDVLNGPCVQSCLRLVHKLQQRPVTFIYRLEQLCQLAAEHGACYHVWEALLAVRRVGFLGAIPTESYLKAILRECRQRLIPDLHQTVALLTRLGGTDRRPAEIPAPSTQEAEIPAPSNQESLLIYALSIPEAMIPIAVIRQLLAADAENVANKKLIHRHCKRPNASKELAALLLQQPESLTLHHEFFTPLHYAIKSANHALVTLLLTEESAVVPSVTCNRTALDFLCEQNILTPAALNALRLLVKTAPSTALRQRDTTGLTPLHLLCRRHGTQHMSLRAIEIILEVVPAAASKMDGQDYLPLHYACQNGACTDVIACLLKAYPHAARAHTRQRDLPLTLACAANESVETIQLLIEAYPQAVREQNSSGYTPLHCSCLAYNVKLDIVRKLINAWPQSVLQATALSGEYPIQLASRNKTAALHLRWLLETGSSFAGRSSSALGNNLLQTRCTTELHRACVQGSSEVIETIATSNPSWITYMSAMGDNPLHILCKNGRLDSTTVALFSRLGGLEAFVAVDAKANTALHLIMRHDTDLDVVHATIRANPEALHKKNCNGNTPLHLACQGSLSAEGVRLVAHASSMRVASALSRCNGRLSPILVPNGEGQTPIGLAMEEYQKVFSCSEFGFLDGSLLRSFAVLAELCKMLYYGPDLSDLPNASLVRACVALHRKDVRLDPHFIHRCIVQYPEEVRFPDDEGNLPLHIESCIPIEKMVLLNENSLSREADVSRETVLRRLLDIYPDAATQPNKEGFFPLQLMIQNGRSWDYTVARTVRLHPSALILGMNRSFILPHVVHLVNEYCGKDTTYSMLVELLNNEKFINLLSTQENGNRHRNRALPASQDEQISFAC